MKYFSSGPFIQSLQANKASVMKHVLSPQPTDINSLLNLASLTDSPNINAREIIDSPSGRGSSTF